MRVAVIGGGPSGSFFSLRLLAMAKEQGREIDLLLFEPKTFDQLGPIGCNFCAGLLTADNMHRISDAGVDLSGGVIQRTIRGFLTVATGGAERIFAGRGNELYSVYRGCGPGAGGPSEIVSLDQRLFERAVDLGARQVSGSVTSLRRLKGGNNPRFAVGVADDQEWEVDLVVPAFGVNSKGCDMLEGLGEGYRRPPTETAYQAEFRLDRDFIDRTFRNTVVLFNFGRRQARFAALVPKLDFVTVTLIGHEPGWAAMNWLLRQPEVRQYIPKALSGRTKSCICRPKLAIAPARGVVADGLAVIGDAHVSRYYKNGIGSAFYTAEHAARAVLEGLDAATLRRRYLKPCRRKFYFDNRVGKLLFALNDVVARSDVHSGVQLECATATQHRGGRIVRNALWALFTGEIPYTRIAISLLSPEAQLRMFQSYLRRSVGRALRVSSRLGPLVDGGKVAIIGGGVAGSVAALTVLRDASRRGIKVKVTIIEPKVFGNQYNQCLGVLTPPIRRILAEEFGVELPEAMLRRTMTGYRLWFGAESVDLAEEEGGEESVAVRRVELDQLLLDLAEKRGVRVIQSRVTGVEVYPEEVMLFTDGGTYSAEVVIGAFGLDDSMSEAFRREVSYRPPEALTSMVIKIHPSDISSVHAFRGRIQSFIVPLKGTSFGAVVPKGNHLSLVLAGRRVTTRHMLDFLEMDTVKRLLDFDNELGTVFKGSFPNGPAKRYYGDRFVIVGDAAGLVRPFKGKGITSAIITGLRAGETIMNEGISRVAFAQYARRCEPLAGSRWAGRVVQALAHLLGATFGLAPLIRASRRNHQLGRAMFGAVAGTEDYAVTLAVCLRPRVMVTLVTSFVAHLLGFGSRSAPEPVPAETADEPVSPQ